MLTARYTHVPQHEIKVTSKGLVDFDWDEHGHLSVDQKIWKIARDHASFAEFPIIGYTKPLKTLIQWYEEYACRIFDGQIETTIWNPLDQLTRLQESLWVLGYRYDFTCLAENFDEWWEQWETYLENPDQGVSTLTPTPEEWNKVVLGSAMPSKPKKARKRRGFDNPSYEDLNQVPVFFYGPRQRWLAKQNHHDAP